MLHPALFEIFHLFLGTGNFSPATYVSQGISTAQFPGLEAQNACNIR